LKPGARARYSHAGSWFRLLTMNLAYQAAGFWDIYPRDLPAAE
jgi:hypothetical protein